MMEVEKMWAWKGQRKKTMKKKKKGKLGGINIRI